MYRFDAFRIDPEALQLFHGDERIEAPPLTVEVLAFLIENRDRTVGRLELIERFWPRAGTGADASLNTCIRRIRMLLGDAAGEPKYVRTRPRAGYRFIGALREAEPPAVRRQRAPALVALLLTLLLIPAAASLPPASGPAAARRIAIEPVQGLCEYVLFPRFNEGLRETLLARTWRGLPAGYRVVEPPQEADFRLRVSVRQTPRTTFVTATLVRAADGSVVRSEEFAERTRMDDYVPVQQAIAERVARSMNDGIAAAEAGILDTGGIPRS
ncbi:winged helix-turn-helix domain-containing protein [Sphingosinicella sp. CPCC 101087]|uniref:winged helix-turn-helix domain-containing protein n=1 Tax=Sphingosinicella sp. CPCC 101087 TaxID=2497754 RepID=UPI00101E0D78|nr:winged helix-turn-helix domain-containing protein [Sphingosinicella sp. CPCC 101087]